MLTLQVASTAALSKSFLRDIRALLDRAFEGDFTDQDWDHALGGIHVWLIGAERLDLDGDIVCDWRPGEVW